MSGDAREADAPAEGFLTANVLKRSLFRSAVTAALGAPTLTVVAALTFARHDSVVWLIGIFGVPSFAAGALTLVERAAARRPPSLARDVGAGLAAWLVAAIGLALGLLQFAFLDEISKKHGALTFDEALRVMDRAAHLQPILFFVFLAITACAAPTTIARVRGLDRGFRILLVPIASSVLALAVCLLPNVGFRGPDTGVLSVLVGIPALLLPLVFRLTDRLEARFFREESA